MSSKSSYFGAYEAGSGGLGLTAFSQRVIDYVASIPPGRVATYGEVARGCGSPGGARQVARLLHASSRKYGLPWHRVLGKGGYIRLPEGGGREEQALLLEAEGVTVDSFWRVDLESFGV